MALASVTRLRLRRFWIVPLFIFHSLRSLRQARASDGCMAAIINRSGGAFWTLTLWRDSAAMRGFMMSGVHRKVMPKLATWCDEASADHWEQEEAALPSWKSAAERLGREGRCTPLKHPSPAHSAGKALGSSA